MRFSLLWLLAPLLPILQLASGDQVALVDWAGVTRRLGSLASSCGLSCHQPPDNRGCSCEPGCRGLGNCCLDFFTLDQELDTEEAGDINITQTHVVRREDNLNELVKWQIGLMYILMDNAQSWRKMQSLGPKDDQF